MDKYASLKNELLRINEDMATLFARARSVPEWVDDAFDRWEGTCRVIARQIQEETIRVAVVGAIKSGKSTFVNSLLGGDYLKRGAGVVTSIVTRVRKGTGLRATLFFKFWDEVNADIDQALVLFPAIDWRSDTDRFEIRRERERKRLEDALGALDADQLITNETRNMNSVLLASYLQGYDRIQSLISSDNLIKDYDEQHFAEHRQFVGDDSLSVYLKDIQLAVKADGLSDNIEVADCQGSDSPNPLHIAKIQDYLLMTHFIIYVISSRTGLRQADIKFLSMIKKMGIIENILFVVNCDFNEHATMEDLNALTERVAAELGLIKPDPVIYTLSALFNLFGKQGRELSEKDRQRLSQWENETEMVRFCDKETQRFALDFEETLTRERYALLLKNHLERLGVVSSGIRHWIHINQNVVARDAAGAKELIQKIKVNQERMNQIKSMIRSTLDGAIQKIKNELKADVDRFFDFRSGGISGEIIGFIKNCRLDDDRFTENLKTSNFANTLYLVFQEFKQRIDGFMAEVTNPKIIRFVRGEEQRIKSFLDSILLPYESMVQEAIADFDRAVGTFGASLTSTRPYQATAPDFEPLKRLLGLKLPPSDATMRYSAKIKTEAIARLGFYSVIKLFKRILKKPIQNENEQEIQALGDGIRRMKRETEKSIIAHFKDYRENIKFQYIFKLVDAASTHLYQELMDRFQAYSTDLSATVDRISKARFDKKDAAEGLDEMAAAQQRIDERINDMREKIGTALL